MVIRTKKNAPALKHGGYSAARLLPGEDPAALQELQKALVAELSPTGALEEDIVASITRLVWRKRHLATFRVATPKRDGPAIDPDEAEKVYRALIDKIDRSSTSERIFTSEGEEVTIHPSDTPEEAMRKYELFRDDPIYQQQSSFVRREITTFEQLMSILALEERLDAMIDRYLKRLLFLRGLKSLAPAKPSSPPSNQKRLRNV